MKKFLLLLMIISVVLVGCFKKQESEADWEHWGPTTFTTVNNLNGVAMIVKKRIVSSTKITVILENSSNLPILYGDSYLLERKIDGKWYQVPVVGDNQNAFADISNELNPSDRRELEINWDIIYGDLHKGEYRIVKTVLDYSSSKVYGVYDAYYLAAEFTMK